jgi:hypothetical protein
MAANREDARPSRTRRHGPRAPKTHVLWARRAFDAGAGRCVAVKLVVDPHLEPRRCLYVAVEHAGGVDWLPAGKALTYLEATAWATRGF